MREFLIPIYNALDVVFFVYFGIILAIYTLLLLFGAINVFKLYVKLKREDVTSILQSNSLPYITFLLPAYNEAKSILVSINSLLNLTYRYKEVIVINDGSSDDTLAILKKELDLKIIDENYPELIKTKPIKALYRSKKHPEVIVIDKENGTKFDALNAGLNFCKNPYCITVDADSYVDDKGFEIIIRPFLESPLTVSIGAEVAICNGCDINFKQISTEKFPENFISGMQSIEYLRAFLIRSGLDLIHENYINSGAFSCFATDILKKSGGFGPTVGEDLEITLRLHHLLRATKTPFRIAHVQSPVVWTEAPNTLKELSKQRIRWHLSFLESLYYHRLVFFNIKYGFFGIAVYPFVVIFEAFEPLVEILGYLYVIVGLIFGLINVKLLIFLCIVVLCFLFIYNLLCLVIDELTFKKYPSIASLTKLFFCSLFENFGYHQLTLIWRFKAFIRFYDRFDIIKDNSKKLDAMMEAIKKKGKMS